MQEVEGEVIAEENGGPVPEGSVRPLPQRYEQSASPALREVRTAALAAAGGVLAGAATVAAVRAVSNSSSRKGPQRRLGRRSERPANVIASRSFMIDVHLLDR